MKKLIILFLLFSCTTTFAQKRSGTVQYKYTIDWKKIYQELSSLSQKEKDRIQLVYTKWESTSNNMDLIFNPTESLYTYGTSEEVARYSQRETDYVIYRNFEQKNIIELRETLGKSYLIEDDMPNQQWRIMNDLKEIQGHLCMKAVRTDTVKNQEIVAWFAADIPVSMGPELCYGLPGLILGLDIDDGNVIIEADKLELFDEPIKVELPKKMKGKAISPSDLDNKIMEHIKTSIAAKNNPYWSMRY
ncbi:GLPGLI family protein [Arcticibacterium luteifluviistationis]|uniref:GLPGLI family protein n=1 Tax=Arcticibacterium luteifluviistationis TaxID=1784714 RepID=A0A2Z4GDB9_9BACT|nr:GLPGLI family protein [Arcticibacterium luteifluviistationis]AWV98913.1 GLPGLI family protein [Arcticibacterium luteifluviistationis]